MTEKDATAEHRPGIDCTPKLDENGMVIGARCPTCQRYGVIVFVCPKCKTKNEELTKVEHKFSTFTFEMFGGACQTCIDGMPSVEPRQVVETTGVSPSPTPPEARAKARGPLPHGKHPMDAGVAELELAPPPTPDQPKPQAVAPPVSAAELKARKERYDHRHELAAAAFKPLHPKDLPS